LQQQPHHQDASSTDQVLALSADARHERTT
jgi:hypothetical protein